NGQLGYAGHVSSRPRKAVNKTSFNRITTKVENNRYRLRGHLGRTGRRTRRHNDLNFLLNQFFCQLSQPGCLLCSSIFYDHILAFNVAKLAHALAECLKINREYSGLTEKAYLSYFGWLLCFDWIITNENQPKHH